MMRWLKAVMQRLGKMVCLFTTPSMQEMDSPYCNANKQRVAFGQACQDAQELAQQKRKRKLKAVQADTTEQSPKQTQKVALAVLGQGGLQRVILASQPVSQSPKPKRSVVQRTTQEQSPKRTQKPVQTTNGKDGSQQVTPASKTPQRAKVAPTKKAKAVVSTTQGKKRTQGKTPAKTPTARQRKVRGA